MDPPLKVKRKTVQIEINNHLDKYSDIISNAVFTIKDKKVNNAQWFHEIINQLFNIKRKKKRLFFIGNGASCSMASHFSVDFTKNGGIPSFSNNEGALLTCFGNDFCFEDLYAEILRRKMENGDILIAISSSGRSKNIINAVEFVKNNYKNSIIVTFTAFSPDNTLRKIGTYNHFLQTNDYGLAESGHAYYLHMLIDLFIQMQKN